MTYDPQAAAARRHRRRQKLGADACCIGCGESNPAILIRAKRTLLEQHHPLGQAHAPDLTVSVCRNFHAILSAAQVDDGVPLEPQPTMLERLVAIFQAFVSFLSTLAAELSKWAVRAAGLIAGLDADYPDWRTHPWAT